jgi:HKD family nuclease
MKPLLDEEVLNAFLAAMKDVGKFSIATALVTSTGLDLILASMRSAFDRGAIGRLLFGIDMPTEPEAIDSLMKLKTHYPNQLQLKRFGGSPRFFHPKFAVFEGKSRRRTAIAGSSNCTAGGFSNNREVNMLFTETSAVNAFLGYFDELFEGGYGKLVSKAWLDKYQLLWDERERNRKEFDALRRKVRQIPLRSSDIPKRIKGHVFAFTGRIKDWPRNRVLYPQISRYGGKVTTGGWGFASTNCLVHGEILGGRETVWL